MNNENTEFLKAENLKEIPGVKEREAALVRVSGVMQSCALPLWGACGFAAFSERLLPCRAAERLPKGAKSILCLLFPYKTEIGAHNVSRYAVPPDYHPLVLSLLSKAERALSEAFPDHSFVPFADNSPIPEVAAAARCGLGTVGKNGLLLHPEYGSWVFIGELVTSLPLPEFGEEEKSCGDCGACRRACPGGALSGEGLCKERCVSRISQKKGELTPAEEALILKSGLAWGCDRCQEVCPKNRGARETGLSCFRENLICLAGENEADHPEGRAYSWRGPEVLKRNLRIFNAAAGNAKENP